MSKTTSTLPDQSLEQLKRKALRDYKRGDLLRAISVRYGKSIPTISSWAREAGLTRRQQGCKIKKWPEPRDLRIVGAVNAVVMGKPTLEEIGRTEGGLTRAGVHRIYRKWKGWKPRPPFEAGDTVRFAGCDYRVLEPDIFNGKVKDVTTGKEVVIPWKLGEDFAVKIG